LIASAFVLLSALIPLALYNFALDITRALAYIRGMERATSAAKKAVTYSAIILSGSGAGRVIYAHEPAGNLIGLLPRGSTRMPQTVDPSDPLGCGMLLRRDGGDPFECARFQAPSGCVIEIKRD
jgi:hypothetical protein